jgi:hypothetical protein
MNDLGVIDQPEIITTRAAQNGSGTPQVSEQPVWGIDCFTRFNISTMLPSSFSDAEKEAFVEE